ncbi:MAG: sodium:proton antiporter [Elusimicrobiota bacterium]|jgi:CPA1 family monovalent cation:H+ antiporter|nr:sodium:proton antiporter [Elusimicrobiota bacterium]
MLLFESILILLLCILISTLINRFIPFISTPLVQVSLGAIVVWLPLNFHLSFNPELFFILFIAPFIYRSGVLLDKKTFWAQKKPILNLSVFLVFATVLGIGAFVHYLLPVISIAAAFAMIASLGPTDDMAVAYAAKISKIPKKIFNILQGESMLNDVSGIVSFQFALAAVVGGTFSIWQAGSRFVIIGAGGVLFGALFMLVRHIFVHWIRNLGIVNTVLHILIEILTPFLVYIIARYFGVSDVIAVFTAGVLQSFTNNRLIPEATSLEMSSESVWSVISFVLEGLVFLILGAQLPQIIETMLNNSYIINNRQIIFIVLAITASFMLSRFLWSFFTISKDNLTSEEEPIGKVKASLIISLSGARGAVTLASVMSIPLLLANGEQFPQRDLIILITAGIIILSLLIANFILPLLMRRQKEESKKDEISVRFEILQTVIERLKKIIEPRNQNAVEAIMRNYYARVRQLSFQNSLFFDEKSKTALRKEIFEMDKTNTQNLLNQNKIDAFTVQFYMETLKHRQDIAAKNFHNPFKTYIRLLKLMTSFKKQNNSMKSRIKIARLVRVNIHYIIERLNKMLASKTTEYPAALIEKNISDYELLLLSYADKRRSRKAAKSKTAVKAAAGLVQIKDIMPIAFQFERDAIQAAFENGKLSKPSAKEMRKNLYILEMQMEE